MRPLLLQFTFIVAVLSSLGSSASGQCLAQGLEGTGPFTTDAFGKGLSADADRLAVGAPNSSNGNFTSGAVYIYREDALGYAQEVRLSGGAGQTGADDFGFSVAMESTRLLVGAPGANGFATNSGSVHSYLRSGLTWTAGLDLFPGEADPGDGFGWSIAVDNNIAVISSPFRDTAASGSGGGRVYVFEWNGSFWQYQTKLTPNDLVDQDLFGHSVAIDGLRIVVGAPAQASGAAFSGVAYVYDRVGANWSLSSKVVPGESTTNAFFGTDVAVSGDEVMIGAPGALGVGGSSTGAVYFFDDTSGNWSHGTKLINPEGGAGDRFGHAIEMEGARALVGAPFTDGGGNLSYGSALILDKTSGPWGIKFTILGPGVSAGNKNFGADLVLVGGDLAVADTASGEGHLYVYLLGGEDCNNNGIPDDCDLQAGTSLDADFNGIPDECAPCSSASECHSSQNSTGSAAVLSFSGSQSLGANDFVLHAGPVPNQMGLFFFGPGANDFPLGNGTLCVLGPIQRMAPVLASGNVLSMALDFEDLSTPAAGISLNSVWHFQAWFRDSAAGGSFYNLSDAMKISFCL